MRAALTWPGRGLHSPTRRAALRRPRQPQDASHIVSLLSQKGRELCVPDEGPVHLHFMKSWTEGGAPQRHNREAHQDDSIGSPTCSCIMEIRLCRCLPQRQHLVRLVFTFMETSDTNMNVLQQFYKTILSTTNEWNFGQPQGWFPPHNVWALKCSRAKGKAGSIRSITHKVDQELKMGGRI